MHIIQTMAAEIIRITALGGGPSKDENLSPGHQQEKRRGERKQRDNRV